jgi:hypothetical protein
MVRDDFGRLDWAAVTGLAATVAALAAVATAAVLFWQVRQEARRARFSTAVESVWQLNDQWNSATMVDVRSAAAGELLSGKPTSDVDAVLNFFEEVVLLVNRGAADERLAALQFYWPMANYWVASRDYVRQVQQDEPSAWADVRAMVTRFGAIEARRQRTPGAAVLPAAAEVQQFLTDEQGGDECSDDSEVQKTPL